VNVEGKDDLITGNDGGNTLNGTVGQDTINGNGGNDTIFAGDDDDSVDGGSGNDVIDGGNGADDLFGGSGTDTLIGGAGADSLDGGSGNDTLIGGAGMDELTGSSGNDMFRFNGTADAFDTITDFFRTQDKVQVDKSEFGFTTLVVTSNLGGTAVGGAKQFIYNETTDVLSYDSDGTGGTAAVQIAQFNASVNFLNLSDFIVVA
jgi:Ca2+-binding RTX toxin-like protein